MAYARTPIVRQGVVHDQATQLPVDSLAWFAWLEGASRFYYIAQHPAYRLTVRKERRRRGWYWFAYVKRGGKLHNAYLGKSAALTGHKLETAAVCLNHQADRQARSARQGDGA